MNSMSDVQSVMNHQFLMARIRNKERMEYWRNRMEKHVELKANLDLYSKKLKQPIMVPLGHKAFMKGHLVHTNEVLVSIGANHFVLVSSHDAQEICERRIQSATEMMTNLSKELQLLDSRLEIPSVFGAFPGSGEEKEIIEEYDEAKETKWKEKHRENICKYMKELSSMKRTGQSENMTEEELWKHLDYLELQEELEDEIDRLYSDDEEFESDFEENDEKDVNDDDDDISKPVAATENEPKKTVKKVSFQEPEPQPPKSTPLSDISVTTAVQDIVQENVQTSSLQSKAERPLSKFKQSRQSMK